MARNLTFVNITTPSQLDSRPVRKQIRSNASAYSWQERSQRSRSGIKQEDQDSEDILADEDDDDIHSTLEAKPHSLYLPAASARGLGSGWCDPFYTYPVPFQPWMPWMLDYYVNIFLPRAFQAINVAEEEAEAWKIHTLRLCMGEPVFFYAQFFSASGVLVESGRISPELPIWLRGEIVKTLNEALDDPKRALSNAVIMSVGRVVIYEAMYGDKDAAKNIHRPAYRWMINARGGIYAMGVPDLTIRLMNWTDRIMTAVLGPPGDGVDHMRLKDGHTIDPHDINKFKPGTVQGPSRPESSHNDEYAGPT
ncbi:hypothetical protein Q7P37_001427 [Cladosporium fusiforme]